MTTSALDQLDALLGSRLQERWLDSASTLERYAQSEAHHGGHIPQRAAQPKTVEEVQAIVRAAYERRVPLIAYGAGTSLEGNAEALHGGISIDLSLMNRIMEVRPEDLLVVVEPGVTRE